MNKLHKHASGSILSTALWALLIAVVAIYLLVKLFLSSTYIDADISTDKATKTRIMPTGILVLGDGIPEGERTGEQVFDKVCIQCHAADSNVANSPKMDDAASWAPHIAKGFETLIENAINGINAMPARGGSPSLTDEELARAIAYMANSAGADFKAPEADEESEDEDSGSEEQSDEDATEEEATDDSENTEAE